MNPQCVFCSANIDLGQGAKFSFHEECTACGRDLHCCRMCQFYDPNAYNECRESSADRVVDKEKRNYCDYFRVGNNSGGSDSKQSALDAAKALFKD